MTDSQKSSTSDVSAESVKQAGKTLQDIVAQLSGQPVFLFGIAVMLLAIAAIFATAFAQSISQLAMFPYVVLAFGLFLVFLSYHSTSKPVPDSQKQIGSRPDPLMHPAETDMLACAVARPTNLSFEVSDSAQFPAGWFNSIGFVDGVSTVYSARIVDRLDSIGGACVEFQNPHASESEFGSLMQRIPAKGLAGKVIRLEAEVRTYQVEQWAGLWLRADGNHKFNLVFDNMSRRPIRGTTVWQKYMIDVQLPHETTWLNYGVVLAGRGILWADNFRVLVWSDNNVWEDL